MFQRQPVNRGHGKQQAAGVKSPADDGGGCILGFGSAEFYYLSGNFASALPIQLQRHYDKDWFKTKDPSKKE